MENQRILGAAGGKKTAETRSAAHFKTGAFNHSATHPFAHRFSAVKAGNSNGEAALCTSLAVSAIFSPT